MVEVHDVYEVGVQVVVFLFVGIIVALMYY